MNDSNLIDEIKVVEDADRLRGEYLSYVNQVERYIEEIISKYFFGEVNENFIKSVLDDQTISFYSLRAIFVNCLNLKKIDSKKVVWYDTRIQEFGRLRNDIIHGHILTQWEDGVYKKTVIRRGVKQQDFSLPSDRFIELFNELIGELIKELN